MSIDQTKLLEITEQNKEMGIYLPRDPRLSPAEADKALDEITKQAKTGNHEMTGFGLAILFQRGGSNRGCDGNLEAHFGEKLSLKLSLVRKALKDVGLARNRRKLARSLASHIYVACNSLSIPGNLYNAIAGTQDASVLTDEEKVWPSGLQNGNPECPEKLQSMAKELFSSKLTTRTARSKRQS